MAPNRPDYVFNLENIEVLFKYLIKLMFAFELKSAKLGLIGQLHCSPFTATITPCSQGSFS